jgi:hypothetical protein
MNRQDVVEGLRELADFIEAHDLDVIRSGVVQVVDAPLELFFGAEVFRYADAMPDGLLSLTREFGPARLVTTTTPQAWAKALHPSAENAA